MLESLKKLVGASKAAEASDTAETVSLEQHTALQAEFADYKTTAEELLAAADSQLKESAEKVAEAVSLIDSLQAKVAALVAEKAEMEAAAKAAKLAARKEKIVAAIGTERADALMVATEEMDDAAFEAVVSAVTGGAAAEANSAMFTETGVAAEVNAAKVIEKSKEMQILEAKYGVKK